MTDEQAKALKSFLLGAGLASVLWFSFGLLCAALAFGWRGVFAYFALLVIRHPVNTRLPRELRSVE